MNRSLAVLLVLAACRTQAPQSLTTRDAAELSAASSAVSATLLSDPNAPTAELAPGEEFVPARLDGDNPAPIYPADLIRRNLPPHKIVVRILFDETGHVLDVAPSPLEASTVGVYTPRFEAAVCTRLLQFWRVWPPEIRKFRPGPDSDNDGKADYRILVDRKQLKTYFDVAFTFEIVNGEPVVRRQ